MSLLEVKNITAGYDGVSIIKDINFTVSKGEIVCLIGTSGVGKSTLFGVLSGLNIPISGEVILDNENIVGKTGKVSYMLQKDLLFPFKTIIDNVSLPYRLKDSWKSTYSLPTSERIKNVIFKKSIARKKVAPYFKQFGLDGTEKKYPRELSGGMRQRAAFMRTYFMDKPLMLLDEPFSALDEITKNEMYEWYLDISKQLNLTTIFISHSLDEAITLSNRILVMSGKPGQIIKEIVIDKSGEKDFATSNKFMKYKRELKDLLR